MGTLAFLFNFFFGVSFCIYFYCLFFKKDYSSSSSSNSKSSSTAFAKKIYLNVYFVDRKEVIRNIIRSKVPRNRPVIRALAKRAAIALLEKGIVERVASGLCKAIPERMDIMGVKTNVVIGYTQSAYCCIEVTLVSLDLLKFLTFNAGKDKGPNIVNILDTYSIPAVTEWLKRFILEFMAGKLCQQLPITMKEKLHGKMNAEVEIIACSEEEQGPYLIQTINQITSDSKEAKDKDGGSMKDDGDNMMEDN